MRRRLSSTISNALPGSMDLEEHVGRDEASTETDLPTARKRPNHLRAVAGVTPWARPASLKNRLLNVI